MSLIRGMRSMFQKYSRDYAVTTNANGISEIILEMNDDEDCSVKIINDFPESISLTASMVPETRFNNDLFIEMKDGKTQFEKNKIYEKPNFHSASNIKNKAGFCSQLIVKYENNGEYTIEGNTRFFFGMSFDDYEIIFSDEVLGDKHGIDDFVSDKHTEILFEKSFPIQNDSIVFHKTGKERKIYPYGGIFEYGMPPQNIESCFFEIKEEGSIPKIIIKTLKQFISSLSHSPSISTTNLYEDFVSGNCTFELLNKITSEKRRYKSDALYHIKGTNFIKINFVRDA